MCVASKAVRVEMRGWVLRVVISGLSSRTFEIWVGILTPL